jgi:hypothetical protein
MKDTRGSAEDSLTESKTHRVQTGGCGMNVDRAVLLFLPPMRHTPGSSGCCARTDAHNERVQQPRRLHL